MSKSSNEQTASAAGVVTKAEDAAQAVGDSLTEVSPYAGMNSKRRKRHPLRSRGWQGKVVVFRAANRERLQEHSPGDYSDFSLFRVVVDGDQVGWYWVWSDEKRSGRGAVTLKEWESGQRRNGEDNGCSHAEAVAAMLQRADIDRRTPTADTPTTEARDATK